LKKTFTPTFTLNSKHFVSWFFPSFSWFQYLIHIHISQSHIHLSNSFIHVFVFSFHILFKRSWASLRMIFFQDLLLFSSSFILCSIFSSSYSIWHSFSLIWNHLIWLSYHFHHEIECNLIVTDFEMQLIEWLKHTL